MSDDEKINLENYNYNNKSQNLNSPFSLKALQYLGIEEKEINTALIEKGHKYADWIINETKMKIDYNSKYWLSVIKEQKEDNIFKKIIKLLKKWQRKMINNNY